MNKSIFFFDIDGTIANQNTILESTIKALTLLKEKGHYVFIATGRPEVLIKGILKQFDFDGYVVLNGGACYYNNELVYEHFIDSNKIEDIINEINKNDDAYALLTKTEYVTNNNNNEIIINYTKHFGLPKQCNNNYYKENNIKAISIHAKDYNYYINKFINLNFYKINDLGYEVSTNQYSKATGCLKMKELLNVETIYTFGDETNDIEMMKCADISIAMGNAVDELKEISTHVTKDYLDDGIYHALKNILKVI